jgi:hypothetical protein
LPPWWDCAVCGQLWPCDTERERLQQEYQDRPDLLGKHLHGQMEQAARYVGNPAELYERFLAWALPPARSASTTNSKKGKTNYQ